MATNTRKDRSSSRRRRESESPNTGRSTDPAKGRHGGLEEGIVPLDGAISSDACVRAPNDEKRRGRTEAHGRSRPDGRKAG